MTSILADDSLTLQQNVLLMNTSHRLGHRTGFFERLLMRAHSHLFQFHTERRIPGGLLAQLWIILLYFISVGMQVGGFLFLSGFLFILLRPFLLQFLFQLHMAIKYYRWDYL